MIHIEPLAPAKPALGQACNGCGICCLAEPCPLGVLLFRRRSGACPALVWDTEVARYHCGALVDAGGTARQALPLPVRFLEPVLARVLKRGAARWIASGIGCDSTLQPLPVPAWPGATPTQPPHANEGLSHD